MGEAARTSEHRMRAAVQDMVTALDAHGDKLVRTEAIAVLGAVVGAFALVWGGEEEIVGGAARVAQALVEQRRAHAAAEEDAVLFELHKAIGDEPHSPELVDEWADRHPGHAAAIRERAADIAAMQDRMAEADAAVPA